MTEPTSLTGHLLIAMPTLADPNFSRTVTYICEHSDQGTLGIVINRPLDMDLGSVFEQLSLDVKDPALSGRPVLSGGPVHQERGFVLHDADLSFDSTLAVGDAIHVTTSQDILAAIADGRGPRRALLALGYAGWGAGQLEQEIFDNAWLSVPATDVLLFETPFERRWQEAARLLGIDLSTISASPGHA